jgi:hypothetical protein
LTPDPHPPFRTAAETPEGRCRGFRKEDRGPCGYPLAKDRDDQLCRRHGYLADALAHLEEWVAEPDPNATLKALAELLAPETVASNEPETVASNDPMLYAGLDEALAESNAALDELGL